MKTIYEKYDHLHPILRAMLAYNDYDGDAVTERDISATSIMKPAHMTALTRANFAADRRINIEGMIPSVMGNAMHTLMEKSLENTDDEMWKALGVPKPEKLDILVENREVLDIGEFDLSGKYDVMIAYDGSKYQLMDLKTMSVWGVMIDLKGKKEEWIKQLSIYRFLNKDKYDVDDHAVILYWFTDWSKSDSRAKKDYPPMRVGSYDIILWDDAKTEAYLKGQAAQIKRGVDNYKATGKTGLSCAESELWPKKESYAYYAKADAKRATKVCDTFNDADDLRLKAKDPTAYVEHRRGEKTRCAYCSVLEFCEQGQAYKVMGLVPTL